MNTKQSFYRRSHCVLLITFGLIAFSSCQKEGPIGPAGTNGTNGTNGRDGNANVKSGTISFTNADWKWFAYWGYTVGGTTFIKTARYADINTPLVTQEIEDKGSVQVFFQNSIGWTPLPFQFQDFSNAYQYNIVYDHRKDKIRLYYFITANQTGVTLPDLQTLVLPAYKFKYIITAAN